MKFRKKPAVVDAWSVAGIIQVAEWALPGPVKKAIAAGTIKVCDTSLTVKTPEEGEVDADMSSMVIMSGTGNFNVMEQDVFNEIYEEIK